ncbi:PREDICTED: uncharacterized protein LOC109159406 [Ipomoea nil]|uniref:uncharacterized protein LOC109159406 n=1 Tax=Ipomoea nil TaxID=35883 RepID=UPI000900E075|nr:PREDICTED: uncharacterized protein LOC109159406 [Ipomoea nil]
MVALRSRGIEADMSCPLCRQSNESLMHLFCECGLVIPLWQDIMQCNLPGTITDFAAWMAGNIALSDNASNLNCIALWWCIWRSRNEIVWNNKSWQPAHIKLEVARLVHEWQERMEALKGGGARLENTSASNTVSADMFMLYVDAAVFTATHEASYGVVITQANGNFVAAKNGQVQCMDDVHLAEAIAIKEALSWAKERGILKARVHSDCQMICKLLNGSLPDYTYAGCILSECRDLQRHFDIVSIQYVSRSVNMAAHALARAARSQPDPMIWSISLPRCIEHLF